VGRPVDANDNLCIAIQPLHNKDAGLVSDDGPSVPNRHLGVWNRNPVISACGLHLANYTHRTRQRLGATVRLRVAALVTVARGVVRCILPLVGNHVGDLVAADILPTASGN